MRIAIVYDCLYPYTVGGAERRYRSLVAHLAQRHEVTYLTRRQWERGAVLEAPPQVHVVAVSGGRQLYVGSGRRRIVPPLRFGLGIFWYLLRHRREFDVVHTCSFPYFSLIAARLACAFGGPPVVTDWYEVWTGHYWREYLGPNAGRIGAAVQSLCVRLSGPAFVFSELHAARLREQGYRGRPILLKGTYAGPVDQSAPRQARDPVVVYIGRHIPEKRVPAIPAAIALARARIPGLRATIFGDGPDRPRVLKEIERLGLQDVIDCPGFARWETVDAELRRAMCLILPSRREGLGLGIVEALARGTPAVVARGPDNAATELIEEHHNGFIAESADPAVLAGAITAVHDGGLQLLARTHSWFAANAARLTIDASIGELEALYADAVGRGAQRVNGHAIAPSPSIAVEPIGALGADERRRP
jgi:glycosyltransferase involved in cell wall biosynthesis